MRRYLLFLILIFGLFLRIVDIGGNPKALYGDELTLVYDSYSILHTGHDQKGNFLPVVFELGGGRPPVYVYSTIPAVALFGPSALAARAVSVLSGLGLIFLIYLLTKDLLGYRIGIWAAFLYAISPWDISLSRGGFESHEALFLSVLGIWLLFKAKKLIHFFYAGLLLGLSIYTYPTYRLTIPLFVLVLMFIHKFAHLPGLDWKKKNLILFTLTVGIFFLTSVYLNFSRGQSDRFNQINILSQDSFVQATLQRINAQRSQDTLPPGLSAIFHNRVLEYAQFLSENYAKNLLPDFIFLHGDSNPRHNPTVSGEMYVVEIIIFILGLAYLNQRKKSLIMFLVGWILISPVATSLVGEPHAIRDSFMLAPLIIISAAGAFYLFTSTLVWSRPIQTIFIIGFLIQFLIFIDRLYFLSPNQFANFWSYSAKQASEEAMINLNKYDRIFLSTRITDMEFAYPVYAQVAPLNVIDQNLSPVKIAGEEFKRYGNVYIGSIPPAQIEQLIKSLGGNSLYIGTADDKNYLKHAAVLNGCDGLPTIAAEEI